MADVDADDEAEKIELDALDPADLGAGDAPQVELDARAAVGKPGIETWPEVAADGVWRHHRAELGDRTQDGRDKGVGVRPRPDAVVAGVAILIGLHRRLDPRDQLLRLGAGNVGDHRRPVAEPAAVRRPAVDAYRVAPAHHVEAGPPGRVLALDHDPAVHRDHALPAAGAAGHH